MKNKFTFFLFVVPAALTILLSGCHGVPWHFPPAPAREVEAPQADAHATTPASAAIKKTVHAQTALFWVGGIVCLGLAAFMGYCGQVIPALKFGAAGVLLPVFGVWWAFHYGTVIIVALIASAVGFLWAERRSVFVQTMFEDAKAELFALKRRASGDQPTNSPAVPGLSPAPAKLG